MKQKREYTDLEKLTWYGKRVRDKSLSLDQRKFAEKRYNQLIKKDTIPKFEFNYRQFMTGKSYGPKIQSVQEVIDGIGGRKQFAMTKSDGSGKREKILDYIFDREIELNKFVRKNKLKNYDQIVVY